MREPNDPIALERCYETAPEQWTDEMLAAAVEMQRREREGRLAAKQRKRARERPLKAAVVEESSNEEATEEADE